jgi:hypothetical protein
METQRITADSNHTNVTRLFGFNFVETGSTAAVVELYSGDDTGDPIETVNLASDQSGTLVLPKAVFWRFDEGCYVKVTGTVTGSLFY